MTHDAVWFSRPRKFGKGSRQWSVLTDISIYLSLKTNLLHIAADCVLTRQVSSVNTALTSAVNVSEKSLLPLALSRSVSTLLYSIYLPPLTWFFFTESVKREYIRIHKSICYPHVYFITTPLCNHQKSKKQLQQPNEFIHIEE